LHDHLYGRPHRRVKIDGFPLRGKATGRNGNLITVEGDVGELKLSQRVGRGCPVQAAARVGQMNGRIGNHGAARIGYCAADDACAAALARQMCRSQCQNENGKNAKNRAASQRHRVPPNRSFMMRKTRPRREIAESFAHWGVYPSFVQPGRMRRCFAHVKQRSATNKRRLMRTTGN
jgi:hypothetical protein